MQVIERKVDPGDALLIPGDMHCDKEDRPAINVMLKVARAARVNRACLVGDNNESAGISRHKSLRAARNFRFGKGTIKSEARHLGPILKEIEKFATKSRDCLTGNHELWWEEVQEEFPGLSEHEWFEVYGGIFDNWEVRAEYTAIKYGPLLVCHGHRLRGSLSKYAAATILSNYPGQNTVCGHNHRLDVATTPTFKYGQQVFHGAWTVGHLKRRDIEIKEKNIGPFSEKHQQGFGIATFFSRGAGKLGFDMQLYRIHRDANDRPMVIYGGEVYK